VISSASVPRTETNTDSLDGPLFVLGAKFTVITPLELARMAADWGSRYVRAGHHHG
jgi:hypothetical protein